MYHLENHIMSLLWLILKELVNNLKFYQFKF